MGILEASVKIALEKGNAFGVVTTGSSWIGPLTRAIKEVASSSKPSEVIGFEERFSGVEATDIGVLDFHPVDGGDGAAEKQDDVEARVGAATRSLMMRGADVIVLGCAGMEGMGEAVQKGASTPPKVVDGVTAGVELLIRALRAVGDGVARAA